MLNEVKSYTDLVEFVCSLPASCAPGGMVPKYNHLESIIDPRVEKAINAKEAIYVFDKYFISSVDRRKLVAAILNIKIIG